MSKLDVSVIGAGRVGGGIVQDFIETDPKYHIRVFDVYQGALDEVRSLDKDRISTCSLDANDSGAVAEAISGSSVVVNATDGTQCEPILKGAIEAKVNYIDVHGVFLYERLDHKEAAEQAGITAMLGMGCSPGIANMLGAYGARKVSGKVSIDLEYVTHRALNSSPGLLETALRQFFTHVRSPLWEDGVLKEMMPFEGLKTVRFPTIDEDVELVYTPHSEPRTIPMFVEGLSRVSVRGTYDPETMRLIRALYDFGLLDNSRTVTIDGKEHDFRPLLKQALVGDGSLKPKDIKPKYMLRVIVTGEDEKTTQRREFVVGHPDDWDPLPQGRLTALPTSFAAQLIASGEFVSPGICGPELMQDDQVEACLAHLQSRGLLVDEAQSTSHR